MFGYRLYLRSMGVAALRVTDTGSGGPWEWRTRTLMPPTCGVS